MKIELTNQPASTIAKCYLQPNESLVSEGGAFMLSKGPLHLTTTTHQKKSGGFISGVKRMLSGENFFLNHYKAHQDSELWLCSPLSGDMMVKKLSGEQIIVSGGSFVACDENVQLDFEWQGLKSLFSGESLFWLKLQGHGDVILNSFGYIYPIEIDGEYIVDTGHIVAFEETLKFSISKASKGWIDSYLSGEGLVCRFQGKGTVWCQSHNPQSYGESLTPFLRPRRG